MKQNGSIDMVAKIESIGVVVSIEARAAKRGYYQQPEDNQESKERDRSPSLLPNWISAMN